MTILTKIFAGAAGLAAIAAAPAAAQYGYSPYGNAYGYYGQNNMTNVAVQRCTAAVQNRLHNRTGLSGIFGRALGTHVATGRVLNITQVAPRNNRTVRVRGLANSGYSPYGVGAYGAVGYGYQPDLSFKCDVDAWGRVRDIDINRRR